MSKQQSATLPHCDGKTRKQTKCDVLTIRIFKRKGSRFWQALVKGPGLKKRITTKTELKQAAQEFADLAYRHFSRQSRNAPPPHINPPPVLCLKSSSQQPSGSR